MNIDNALDKSIHNRAQVQDSTVCGCYFCCTVFNCGDVVEWIDEGATAICPRCGIDSVFPGVDDTELLMKANERWFTG